MLCLCYTSALSDERERWRRMERKICGHGSVRVGRPPFPGFPRYLSRPRSLLQIVAYSCLILSSACPLFLLSVSCIWLYRDFWDLGCGCSDRTTSNGAVEDKSGRFAQAGYRAGAFCFPCLNVPIHCSIVHAYACAYIPLLPWLGIRFVLGPPYVSILFVPHSFFFSFVF